VAQGRSNRLVRLEAPDTSADSAKAGDRAVLGARALVCTIVRDRLTQSGIDPTSVPALRLAPEFDPAAALPLPNTRRRKERGPSGARQGRDEDRIKKAFAEFAASDDDSLAGLFAEKIREMSSRYSDGQEPDFASASLAELFAWCLAESPQGSEHTV
jgi:hypothetical protein